MANNTIAKTFRILGISIIIIGVIVSIIIGSYAENAIITVSYIVSSFFVGIIFICFSEIINLLQQNVDNQFEIIKQLKKEPQNTTKSEQQATSAQHNPNYHIFRCEKCGTMIEEYPCCHCDYDPK